MCPKLPDSRSPFALLEREAGHETNVTIDYRDYVHVVPIIYDVTILHCVARIPSLVPRPIPSFSMLHAEQREGLGPGMRNHVKRVIYA